MIWNILFPILRNIFCEMLFYLLIYRMIMLANGSWEHFDVNCLIFIMDMRRNHREKPLPVHWLHWESNRACSMRNNDANVVWNRCDNNFKFKRKYRVRKYVFCDNENIFIVFLQKYFASYNERFYSVWFCNMSFFLENIAIFPVR